MLRLDKYINDQRTLAALIELNNISSFKIFLGIIEDEKNNELINAMKSQSKDESPKSLKSLNNANALNWVLQLVDESKKINEGLT
tara:strand:+ start:5095 stop:5349 length:255 start_codon:yes stop_codon:yes gene_type:complete